MALAGFLEKCKSEGRFSRIDSMPRVPQPEGNRGEGEEQRPWGSLSGRPASGLFFFLNLYERHGTAGHIRQLAVPFLDSLHLGFDLAEFDKLRRDDLALKPQ